MSSVRVSKRMIAIYLLLMAFCLLAVARRPMAFQKSAVITDKALSPRSSNRGEALNVARFMGDIEFTDRAAMVYEVHPKKKYEKTIQGGMGNCSNLCFGAAYELGERDIPYDIVFFLPKSTFLDGDGHAILSTTCTLGDSTFDCLVDVLESGLPMSGSRHVGLDELYRGAIADFSIHSLNKINKTNSTFYGEFLNESTIGILQGQDIGDYFRFIEVVYIPLGHPKLEKLVFDGLAVLAGVYPRIHVRSIDETFAGAMATRRFYVGLLWAFRLGIGLGLAMAVWGLIVAGRRASDRRSEDKFA